jgi:hypothetical protein
VERAGEAGFEGLTGEFVRYRGRDAGAVAGTLVEVVL